MRIYTSYFGNYRKLAAANVKMICVALGKPRFYNAPQIIEVAPKRYMLDDKWTYEEYTNMYLNDVLAKVNPQELIQTIQRLSEGKDVALCCYESRVISAIGIFWQNGLPKRPVLKLQSLALLREKNRNMYKQVCFEYENY